MPKSLSFHEHYEQNITPWETNRPDNNLINVIKQLELKPCAVLDAGCGTGHNSIWLAQQGFTVTGWDFVEKAIARAKKNRMEANVSCTFTQLDILDHSQPNSSFDFVFDRGLFHCFKSRNQLTEIVQIIANLLPQDGIWLSLIGNADETRKESGPPQLTAREITEVVEPLFIIDSLVASFFDSDQKTPAKNWVCQMRKR